MSSGYGEIVKISQNPYRIHVNLQRLTDKLTERFSIYFNNLTYVFTVSVSL